MIHNVYWEYCEQIIEIEGYELTYAKTCIVNWLL